MIIEALSKCVAHFIVERKIISVRADDDKPAVRLPAGTQVFDKTVACIENAGKMDACGHIVVAWAAGHKQNHSITCFFRMVETLYPDYFKL